MFSTKLPCLRQFVNSKLCTNVNRCSLSKTYDFTNLSLHSAGKVQTRNYSYSTSGTQSNAIIQSKAKLSEELKVGRNDLKASALFNWKKNEIVFVPIRFAGSYFQKSGKQSDMWKAMTSVSSQGRKRGRAKGLLKIKNINIGQKLGWGRAKVRFPGLSTSPSNRGGENQTISKIDEAEFNQYLDEVKQMRDKFSSGRRRTKQTPLERGWTGGSPKGKKFGAPISTNPELEFDNFESILVQYQMAMKMTGKFGRVRGIRLMMVTGNKNGTVGYTVTQEAFGRGMHVYQKAANRAGLRLFTVPRYENRTVYHDFFSNFGQTRVMVLQKPQGYGVKAHRVITSVCELVGIKDLAVKVEGRINYGHILKAFLLGLLRQRTHQELANEMRLHLVEFREETHNFPKVVASPEDGYIRTKEEIKPDEILDFQVISFDGNKPLLKPKPRPFYERLPSWQQRLKKVKPQEHHFQHRVDMLVEHGREQSQYTDIFPECKSVSDQTKEWEAKKRAAKRGDNEE